MCWFCLFNGSSSVQYYALISNIHLSVQLGCTILLLRANKHTQWPWWLLPLCQSRSFVDPNCLMITLSHLWGAAEIKREGKDELVMLASALSHSGGTTGLVACGSCVCWWWVMLSLQSSWCLPAANRPWQARSSVSVRTWTHCTALTVKKCIEQGFICCI